MGALGYRFPVASWVMMQHYMMRRRSLFYTGITRGKKMVVVVGRKKVIGMAVKGRIERRRWSKLGEWLAPITPP